MRTRALAQVGWPTSCGGGLANFGTVAAASRRGVGLRRAEPAVRASQSRDGSATVGRVGQSVGPPPRSPARGERRPRGRGPWARAGETGWGTRADRLRAENRGSTFAERGHPGSSRERKLADIFPGEGLSVLEDIRRLPSAARVHARSACLSRIGDPRSQNVGHSRCYRDPPKSPRKRGDFAEPGRLCHLGGMPEGMCGILRSERSGP